MKLALELLVKHNVTEYELVTWLASALEYKLSDDDCPERVEAIVDNLNTLSWKIYDGRNE